MVANLFKSEELHVLTKDYRLALERSADHSFSIHAIDLLEPYILLDYLNEVSTLLNASTRIVAASLFSKRYSYLMIASSLYAMTMFDKAFDYSIENCYIDYSKDEQLWLPNLRLAHWDISQPVDGKREEWRDQVIRHIFAENIAVVWRSMSKTAPISKSVLWENTSIYVYWLYEKRMSEGATAEQKMRIEDDFRYLLKAAPAHLFGETLNPLAKFDQPKMLTAKSDEPIRIRKTCCLYYQTCVEEDYCSTCPKLKQEAVSIISS